ncbi:endolytic transglycosylase MltG [Telluribacter sp. SYSU D00476]|uniref:endolytic transglycosylase MltG n=1 Tax=Telluribacter sp. SYSU D00476 TaxID=2811430 RepID=UPI001FF380DD|nr:endolytic transglycosylase MltG [Telluribacter sp. SYSU D00476]
MSRNFKIGIFITLAILVTTFTFYFWQIFKTPNLQLEKEDSFVLLIPEKATYQTVLDTLKKHEVVNDYVSFQFLAKLLDYPESIKPGRYVIKPNTPNYPIIKKLKAGDQDAVKLTFNNIRLKDDLIARIGPRFAFGAEGLREALNSPEVSQKYGFDTVTVVSMFLPNTYEIYWNVSTEKFLDRMHSEYEKFWTDERKAKAKAMNMTPTQVTVLASIVEAETKKEDEKPRVAGVYLNRMEQGMPLQADPTIVFAWRDFSIRRVLNYHTQIKSPYNTYRNVGLPPGPINLPAPTSIDAVLNREDHKYIYFCARADFSGYHAFAENYEDHMKNARDYQQALNRLNIKQ